MEEAMEFNQRSLWVGNMCGRAQTEERGPTGDYTIDHSVLWFALETWISEA